VLVEVEESVDKQTSDLMILEACNKARRERGRRRIGRGGGNREKMERERKGIEKEGEVIEGRGRGRDREGVPSWSPSSSPCITDANPALLCCLCKEAMVR
jgi:hypothetical protein